LIAIVHGTMDRSTSMLRLSRKLDQRFRVLRYDRRGYGRSVPAEGAHQGPFDMARQVDDLVALLDDRRALLVGHSYGGNVALSAATRFPELIAGVAAYETPLSWEAWWPHNTAGAAARATGASPAEAAGAFMRRLIGDAAWERLPAKTRADREAEGAAMVGELRDLADNRPWHADKIHCPVVLGFGSCGAVHHQRGMRHLHEIIPQSELFELAGCRHDAPASHSQQFAGTIVGALAIATGEPWAGAVVRAGDDVSQPSVT